MANLGYGATLRGRDCKVLIYGDATAMVGVDPKIIEAKTGLSTCNIAEAAGVTMVSGTLPVDRFLEGNPRPKVIVFLYAPENLSRPRAWEHIEYFEAITSRLQEEPNAATARTLARHPEQTLAWAERGLRMALTSLGAKPFSDETAHLRDRHLGQMKLEGPTMTGCANKVSGYPPDPVWVKLLRTQYGVGGTKVLVDMTPIADCDPALPYYTEHLVGLVDDRPLPIYPMADYVAEERMLMNARGSAKLSAMISDQLNALAWNSSSSPREGGM
jgi:hypothetical protein